MQSANHKSTIKTAQGVNPCPNPRAGDPSSFANHAAPSPPFDRAAKRIFDIVAATIGLFLFSPIFLFVSIAIKTESRGPILFRQERYGSNGERILVFNFRSDVITRGARNGSHVTRVGRVLRRTGIDGIPQLINVLCGQMSIVGPRPYLTAPDKMIFQQIPVRLWQYKVAPGLTGWAQANGCWTEKEIKRRIGYDAYYIANWSWLLDMKIMLMTIFSRKVYLQ
jgi:lipopolysaccharide/colanic/teichoic acid biosynthesis glycosyltransferase